MYSSKKTGKTVNDNKSLILVSSCLLGINCTYKGDNNYNKKLVTFLKNKLILPICPEQLGGLSTPREPQSILTGNGADVLEGRTEVINIKNIDVTQNFLRGANEVLKLAKMFNVRIAILKDKSPSCGVHQIYNKKNNDISLIQGMGVTSALLVKNGIKIYSENDLELI